MSEEVVVAIACDHAGFPLKQAVVDSLQQRQGIIVLDFGMESAECPEPYYEQAPKVVRAILDGRAEKGILFCGTGQGMAIIANKHKGIYACVVDDGFSGQRAKMINNANVITLGCWTTTLPLAIEAIDGWLGTEFGGSVDAKREFITHAFHQLQALEERNFR